MLLMWACFRRSALTPNSNAGPSLLSSVPVQLEDDSPEDKIHT